MGDPGERVATRTPIPEVVQCPHCWSANPAIESRCQACDRSLAIYIGPPVSIRPRVGLGAMMVAVAVAGLCLSAWRLHPALGILSSAIASLGIGRAYWAIAQEEALGMKPTSWRKLTILVRSLGVVLILFHVAGIVFGFVSLLAVGLFLPLIGPSGILLGLVVGLTAALIMTFQVRRLLLPRYD